MDVHARIQSFLQQQTIVSLVSNADALPDAQYIKAGVVPFVRGNATRYYLMKPVAKRPQLGAPAFQICKGTRMQRTPDKGWADIREGAELGDAEALVATALREGIEELGLKLESITGIIDVGPYKFASSKNGKDKHMWLFAMEMQSVDDVLPMEEVEKTTAERGWLTLSEFSVVGRDDHRYILREIAAKLEKYHATRRT